MNYEYKVVKLEGRQLEKLEHHLNLFGEDGWELTQVIPIEDWYPIYMVFFKRVVRKATPATSASTGEVE